MDPTNPPAPTGELVVQNGRMSGARCPLGDPVTLIGRAEGCDVRLNVDGVEPHHCLLSQSSTGMVLRDLSGATGTLVNGEPAALRVLEDGDLLTVGPFRFRVRLPQDTPQTLAEADVEVLVPEEEREAWLREKEALRIQAAAVVAQQAALTEEEGRLEQRRIALQRQEEQLAGHLEEKRLRLVELQEQVRQARAALRKERGEYEERSGKMLRDLERQRRELTTGHQKMEAERNRLGGLRRRLRERWHRHWDLEQARVAHLDAELKTERQKLEQEKAEFVQQRDALTKERLRFNGEQELGRRRLQDDFDTLRREQHQFQELRSAAQAELKDRLREVEQRETALELARRQLVDEQHRLEALKSRVEQETEGLENRIRNQRRKLVEQEAEAARLDGVLRELRGRTQAGGAEIVPLLPAPVAVPSRALVRDEAHEERLAILERLAGELADQRLYLAEQGRRLLEARALWQAEHAAASDELEALARRLEEREHALLRREREAEEQERALHQLYEEAEHCRAVLDGQQARVAAAARAWEGERERLLLQLRIREERARRQSVGIVELRRRWLEHRRQEVERLRAMHRGCEELRARYAVLWDECLARRSVLEQEHRALAEKALAMEQYRLEMIGRTENSVAADRRLERLRRRVAAVSNGAARKLESDRRTLEAEATRLNARAQELARFQADLVDRDAEFTTTKTAWEQEQRLIDAGNAKLRDELRGLHALRRQLERQVEQLNNELERVVHVLMQPTQRDDAPRVRAA